MGDSPMRMAGGAGRNNEGRATPVAAAGAREEITQEVGVVVDALLDELQSQLEGGDIGTLRAAELLR